MSLLKSLDDLESWPKKVKVMQQNWIGKSYGCELDFKIEGDLPVEESKMLILQDQILYLVFSFLAVCHQIILLQNIYEKDPDFKKFKIGML